MRFITLLAAFSVAAILVATAGAAVPRNTGAPTISGTARQGQTLTVSNGTWDNSPTSFSYQWQRCASDGSGCADISGATSKTYTPASTDVDHRLRAVVTATNADGQSTANSGLTGVVSSSGAPANTSPPTISGTAKVGEELTASPGGWSGGVKLFTYQWERCNATGGACTNVTDATARTYGVRSSDAGMTLRVAVTAHNASGSTTTATSAATSAVQPTGTTTTTTAVAANKRPTISFVSLRRSGARVYARFRVCDDRAGKITVIERDTKTNALSYTRKFTVAITTCGAFSRNWTPASRFRTHGNLVVRLQAQDRSGALSGTTARSLHF